MADAVVCSWLFYGVELTCRSFEYMVQQLSSTYNNTIRALSGLLPSTPASAICVEAGVLPFRYRAAMSICCRAVSYLERTEDDGQVCFLAGQANHALTAVAGSVLPPVAGLHRVGPRSWRAREPLIDNAIKFHFRKGSNPTQVLANFRHRIQNKYRYADIRYTDGSKLAGRVGFGIYGTNLEQSHRLPNQCSVFSAEAAAILTAILEPSENHILIVTDSASSLQALKSSNNKHPFIQAIQAELDNERTSTTFMWVPGHCGIPGNERADAAASIGRQSRIFCNEIPGDDIRKWIKNTLWDAWASEWHQERSLFIRRIKNEVVPWNDLPNWKEQKVLSRLRTGHTRASHNMGDSRNFRKICETCNTQNTVQHFISDCPTLEYLRMQHDITSISRALQNDAVCERTLLNFLKEARLFNEI